MGFVNGAGSSISATEWFGAEKEKYQKQTVKESFSQLLKEKKAECYAGIQRGHCGQSFQIGAGAYTETEWERLLAGFDVAQAKLRVAAEVTEKEVHAHLNEHETGMTVDAGRNQNPKELPDYVENMCYTSEEAFETFFNHRKVESKPPTHEVIDANHLEKYYAKHPYEIGKRSYCYNGRWYSMAELIAVWNRELAEVFGQD